MKLTPPHAPRSNTASFCWPLRQQRWLALFLILLSALLVLTVSAAATCNFLLTWGTSGTGSGQFTTPRGIAVDSTGHVYVPDQFTRVQKFDASGTFILQFGLPGDVPGGFVSPNKAATDSAGNVYVSDSFTNRVQKFDASGTFLLTWGSMGSGDGQFINGSGGVAVDSSGNVYVTDPGNHRIEKFTSTGTFISKWGTNGTGDTQFDTPLGIAVDAANNVYVVDLVNNRVQKFTSTGTFISKWGTSGASDGQFSGPQGIAVDAAGNVYVADSGNNRIQKFTSTGTFIDACGSAGSGNGEFSSPQDVAVDATGNLYVADAGNDRVQKFGVAAAPPVANAGPDQTVECAGGLTPVTLNGTGSTPGSGTINSYTWKEGATTLGTGATLNVSLPAGAHNITLTVTDTGGGSDDDDVVVNIVDTTPPVINLVGANPLTVECHTSFSDPGATATDGCTGSVPVTPSGSVNVNVPGSYTITYSATDGANPATATRTVNVVDTTAPVINCPANIVVTLPPNSLATSMAVSYPAVTATDSCASSVTVNSSPASGSVFPVGTTTVNATASDGSNTATCSFTVTVLYNFTGFFPPVSNLPVFNVVNAGRAIPVKFSLSGYKGLNIFAANSPASGQIACNSSDPAVTLQDTVTAGGSSLNYDASTDQYIYVWKTDAAWAGTCQQLVVQLNDGSVHRANFKFK
jgi:DNA-binding beta-propeller fold protein YncE